MRQRDECSLSGGVHGSRLRPAHRYAVRRILLSGCIAALGLCGPAAAATPPLPTLGLPFEYPAEGFGQIEPSTISLGGDPTGVLENVRWHSWGGRRAVGAGKGWFLPPRATYVSDGHWARARVVAWKLGKCRGQRAYRRVEWYFPQYHRSGHQPPATYFDPHLGIRACNGG